MSEPKLREGEEHLGWDWFEKTERQVQEAREADAIKREELAMQYAAVMTTPQGRAVMADLMRWVMEVKGFDPDRGFYDGAAYGFFREGQNSMVQYIQRMITQGENYAKGGNA